MKKIIIAFLFIAFVIISCNTDNLELSNPGATSTTSFPNNKEELIAGLNATYSPLQSQGLYGRYLFFINDYMADEVQIQLRGTPDLRAYKLYTMKPSNPGIYWYWKNAYNGVSRANFILDKQEKIESISEIEIPLDIKNRSIGEAKFLRAYYYYLLVTKFGDIPLYTSTIVSPNGLPKSPKEEVYQLIIKDLTESAALLPLASSLSGNDIGRATRGAANALLGKIHLYRGENALAKTAFDKVITSGEYELTAEFFDNFDVDHENNSESVFEIQFVYDNGNAWGYAGWDFLDTGFVETTWRAAEYGLVGTGFHNCDPSEDLVAEFEAGDPRLSGFYFDGDAYSSGTITQAMIGTGVTAAWRKNQRSVTVDTDYAGLSDINHRAIRYADVLLMAAETLNAVGGTIDGKTAIDLMNMVRDRASMPNYGTTSMNATFPVGSEAEILTAIIHERRVELAGEQTRFPDLLRWNKTDLLSGFSSGKHEFLPIPQTEIDTNLSLTNGDQNTGY